MNPEAQNDRFELRGELGRGATGVVYRALDRERGEEVALKKVREVTAVLLRGLKREFRIRRDVHHPNLVDVYDLSLHESGDIYCSMELIEGKDLTSYLLPRGPLSKVSKVVDIGLTTNRRMELARPLLAQVVSGLKALHRAGVLHRDVKPDNIRVDRSGRAVLLDFGLAEDQPREEGPIAGTPQYMAPEQFTREPLTSAADLYAVGVMLLEVLVGHRVFDGTGAEMLQAKRSTEQLPKPPPWAPKELAELARALMSPNPADRPNHAEVLRGLGFPHWVNEEEDRAPEVFVGRVLELQALARLALSQSGKVLAIVGRSGMGKSSLLRRFVTRLPPSTVVLSSRCNPMERLPFKAIDSIVDVVSEHMGTGISRNVADLEWLAQLFPVLMSHVPPELRRQAPITVWERRRAFAALARLLKELGQHRRVLVVIDDFQWADLDSLDLIEAVVDEGLAVPMVLMCREEEQDRLLELERRIKVSRMDLGPLSEAETTTLADQVGSDGASLYDRSGGMPYAVAELARGGERCTLDGRVLAALGQVDEQQRELVHLLAVAARPMEIGLVRDIVGGSAGPEVLRQRLVRRLVSDGRSSLAVFHDRVGEVVRKDLGDAVCKGWHARIARALEAAGERAHRIAGHWVKADVGEPAARWALMAAEEAMTGLAWHDVVHHASIAIERGHPKPGEARLLLARAQRGMGMARASAEAFVGAAQVLDGDEALAARIEGVEVLIGAGHLRLGSERLDLLLRGLGLSPHRGVAGVLWTLWRRLLLRFGMKARVGSPTPQQQQLLQATWAAAAALGQFDSVRAYAFQTLHLRMALSSGDARHLYRALLLEGVYTDAAGRDASAVDRLARQVGGRVHTAPELAFARLCEGYRAFLCGRFPEALQVLEGAETAYGAIAANHWERGVCRTHLCFSLRYAGRLVEMERLAESLRRDAAESEDLVTALNAVLGAGWLGPLRQDRPEESEALIHRQCSQWDGQLPPTQDYLRFQCEVGLRLYRDQTEGLQDFVEQGARRYWSLRVFQQVAGLLDWMVAVARVRSGASVGRAARKLCASPIPLLEGLGHSLRWHETGKPEHLEAALGAFRAGRLPVYEACGRLRYGRILKDQALVSAAEEDLENLGIARPDRWAAMLLG